MTRLLQTTTMTTTLPLKPTHRLIALIALIALIHPHPLNATWRHLHTRLDLAVTRAVVLRLSSYSPLSCPRATLVVNR